MLRNPQILLCVPSLSLHTGLYVTLEHVADYKQYIRMTAEHNYKDMLNSTVKNGLVILYAIFHLMSYLFVRNT